MKTALRFFSLDVYEGEVVGILGVNGAGKTTLMNLLTGLVLPTSGWIEIFGFPPGSKSSKRLLGFLPEFFFAPENLTVEHYLREHSALYRIPLWTYWERLRELTEVFGLGSYLHQPIGTLSKGLLRRVGIMRALLHQPRLLLMDEPAWALDPVGRNALHSFLENLKKNGVTMLISSHVLDIVEDLCDRFLILHAGKCVADVHRNSLVEQEQFEIQFDILPENVAVFLEEHALSLTSEDGKKQVLVSPPLKNELVRRLVEGGASVEKIARKRTDLYSILKRLKSEGLLE